MLAASGEASWVCVEWERLHVEVKKTKVTVATINNAFASSEYVLQQSMERLTHSPRVTSRASLYGL